MAAGQHLGAFLVYLDFHGVHLVIIGDYPVAQITIPGTKRQHGIGDLLFHHAAHRQHATADIFQLFVVPPGDVLTQVNLVHIRISLKNKPLSHTGR